MEILDYCMNKYGELSLKELSLNPLHYVSLPGYSFDCCLMSSGFTSDTLQDKQMLDDFVETKSGGICGIMGDRYINHINRSIREPLLHPTFNCYFTSLECVTLLSLWSMRAKKTRSQSDGIFDFRNNSSSQFSISTYCLPIFPVGNL